MSTERVAAERDLGEAVPADKLTRAQARTLVEDLQDVVGALAKADPADKAAVYAELGVPSMTTRAGGWWWEGRPWGDGRVGGGT